MIVETKIAAGFALFGMLFAQLGEAVGVVEQWAALGIQGVLCFLLWWIVAKRDPDIAEMHASAIRDASATTAEAINALRSDLTRQSEATQKLLADALKCTPPPPCHDIQPLRRRDD